MDALFDPRAEVRRVSLVRLSAEIGRSAAGMGRVLTEGEVVKPTVRPSGTIYFTLRDRSAQLSVVCPASRARRCRVVHGERVGVTGTLQWSVDRGQLSLSAEEVAPVGAGAIAAALAECRGRLERDGLLVRRRRAIPRLPAAIGVICGAEAAVRADIASVVGARFPGYPVVWREVAVSGPGAAEGLVGALRSFGGRPEVEVVVLARGGGDAASLLVFSDEELCRAICASPVPVVSAIGHEGDRPLCDEVADLRCGTPSLAAMAVVPDRAELEAGLAQMLAVAAAAVAGRLEGAGRALERVDRAASLRAGWAVASRRLEVAASALTEANPARRAAEAGRALRALDWRNPLPRRVAAGIAELDGRWRTLDALDPGRVLARGYAVVRSASGVVVREPGQVGVGERLEVTLARGSLSAEVLAGGRG
ncbi:MAG: exodeoxyribonuclease VII large subunit [Acidimicrobiales bacterium]